MNAALRRLHRQSLRTNESLVGRLRPPQRAALHARRCRRELQAHAHPHPILWEKLTRNRKLFLRKDGCGGQVDSADRRTVKRFAREIIPAILRLA
jgi:hypothetical protein